MSTPVRPHTGREHLSVGSTPIDFASLAERFDPDVKVGDIGITWAPPNSYPPEVGLFQQGSVAQEVYFIERGLVKLNRVEQDGQQIIVGLRSAGWMMGAAAVILQKTNPVSATTLTRCQLRRLPADVFLHLLKTDVQFSWHIQRSQSREAYEQVGRIGQLTCFSARHRLEQLLWQLSAALDVDDKDKQVRLDVPLKQWEIAQLIGVTPEHLCRMLKQMEDEGVLLRKKGWIVVYEPQNLWHPRDF
jgi:CRP/FNR family transcriptional regulator